MVILLPTILHSVYDWTRLASSIKAIIYDQIDSSFISCFYGAILEIEVNYDVTSDFFYISKDHCRYVIRPFRMVRRRGR